MRLPSHSMLLLKVGIPRGRKTSRQLAIDDVAFQEGIAMVHDIGTSAQHYNNLALFSVFLSKRTNCNKWKRAGTGSLYAAPEQMCPSACPCCGWTAYGQHLLLAQAGKARGRFLGCLNMTEGRKKRVGTCLVKYTCSVCIRCNCAQCKRRVCVESAGCWVLGGAFSVPVKTLTLKVESFHFVFVDSFLEEK